MNNSKNTFSFRSRMDNEIHTDIDTFSDNASYYAELQQAKSSFYQGNKPMERVWRNGELDATDKLLQVDSTYNGQLVKDSTMESDILSYRIALRDYDLMEEARPQRPTWFT
jgi:hypothetical protein